MSQQEPLVIPGEPRLSRRIREAANRDALGRAAVLSGQGDLAAAALIGISVMLIIRRKGSSSSNIKTA